MAGISHACKSDRLTLNRSTKPILRLCLVNALIALLAVCSNAIGANWRGPIASISVHPDAPKTSSWFAFGGVWTDVPTGEWNPRDPHPLETYYFSPDFIDPDIGLPQTIVLGDLNKTYVVDPSYDIIVPGDDASVGNVIVDGGQWAFVFQPLFVPGPMAHGGSLSIAYNLSVDGSVGTPGMLTLSGSGTLTVSDPYEGDLTGVSVRADQVLVDNASIIISNGAKLASGGDSTQARTTGFIGVSAGSTGTVTVTGENSMWQSYSFLAVGEDGNGILSITNGALVDSGTAFIASNAGSTGTVTVTGENSTWENSGQLQVGNDGTGMLAITNGGQISTGGSGFVGTFSEGTGTVEVTGPSALWTISYNLNIGFEGDGTLFVSNGGQVTNDTAFIANGDGSTGKVTVTGHDSTWTNTGTLYVGFGGVGILTVSDNATVQASSIEIGTRGEVDGDGSIIGNVVNGGHVSPGNSPGTLTIEGDYVQDDVGVLELEFAGLDSSQHDRLIVTGDATLDGDVVLKFIDNFAPQHGQQFEFLTVGGTADLSAATFSVQNLAPGFLFDIAPSAAGYMMTALNDGIFVPEPTANTLVIIGLILSVIACRQRRAQKRTADFRRRVIRMFAWIALCFLSAIFWVNVSNAGELMYATDSASDSLYFVDIETGAVTPIGPAGMGIGASTPTALAVHPLNGRIYAANNSPASVAGLLEIDRGTGIATHIGGSVAEIAFDSAGTLYTQLGGGGSTQPAPLGVVDIATGEAISLGGPDLPRFLGLDFNAADGNFYGITSEMELDTAPTLVKVALTGDLLSEVTMSEPIAYPGALAFDTQGTLIGSSINGDLFDINPVTGVMSNFRSSSGPQGLGRVVLVPEPTSIAFALLWNHRFWILRLQNVASMSAALFAVLCALSPFHIGSLRFCHSGKQMCCA